MVIIFYEQEKNVIYLCTDRDKMKILSIDEPDLMSHIPNDDILYVQNANFITKNQFKKWLDGEDSQNSTDFQEDLYPPEEPVGPETEFQPQHKNDKWIHPCHNGAIQIHDIKTKKYPNGIELVGKYDFASIAELGGFELLEESSHYKYLLGKGKIEVVGYDYVKKHYGKKKLVSASDAALEKIIIKNDTQGSAESVAAAGGIGNYADGIEGIIVD